MTPHFSIAPDWYRTFFSDPVLRFSESAIPQSATDAELAFVIQHLGFAAPANILDVPCGTGRHALGLARAGFAVTGFDLSPAAIRRARQRATAARLPVHFIQSDMLDVQVAVPNDALICMGNSIGYFDPATTQRLLQRFSSTLRPGGRLIVDTSMCAESIMPVTPHRTFSFPGGTYAQEIRYDAMASAVDTRAQLTMGVERQELLYRHFVMTSGELVRSLRAARFDDVALFGDAAGGEYAPGAPRLLLVATKR